MRGPCAPARGAVSFTRRPAVAVALAPGAKDAGGGGCADGGCGGGEKAQRAAEKAPRKTAFPREQCFGPRMAANAPSFLHNSPLTNWHGMLRPCPGPEAGASGGGQARRQRGLKDARARIYAQMGGPAELEGPHTGPEHEARGAPEYEGPSETRGVAHHLPRAPHHLPGQREAANPVFRSLFLPFLSARLCSRVASGGDSCSGRPGLCAALGVAMPVRHSPDHGQSPVAAR